jgi:phage gp46-like protein
MGDLALVWTGDRADLAIVDDDLATDSGMRTALVVSLFTDRRAEPDDTPPAGDGDLRGWWADQFAEVQGDLIGSRLWLLDRSTALADVPRRAEEMARQALAWLIEDRIASKIDVAVRAEAPFLIFEIMVHRPLRDPVPYRFQAAWDAEAARG